MTERWTVWTPVDESVDRCEFGPWPVTVPSTFTVGFDSDSDGLRVVIDCQVRTDRVEAVRVEVRRFDHDGNDLGIAARDLTRLQLGELVAEGVACVAQPVDFLMNAFEAGDRAGRKPTPDELKILASVYWLYHLASAGPRRQIMRIWGLSRSTANRWITKAGQLYAMPTTTRGE